MSVCLNREDLEAAGKPAGFAPDEDVCLCDPAVSIDSRLVTPGGVFVALQGERADGHDYVDEVFRRGAFLAVVSSDWFTRHSPGPLLPGRRFLVADDTCHALQELARRYRRHFDIPVIGIGGSNGKTTTKEMVGAVLSTAFRVHMSKGNLNNHLGVPLTILGLRDTHQIAVVEMGINHPGEMELLTSIAMPDYALLTNIGHEHLEFLCDLDGVEEAETVMFRYTAGNGGTLFVNTDDHRLSVAAGDFENKICYGSAPSVNRFWPEKVVLDRRGRTSFRLCSQRGCVDLTLNFAGRHNVHNAVAAASVGDVFRVPLTSIASGLESLVPEEGWKRLERIDAGDVRIFNDTYNANPDSVTMAMKTVCEMPCSGRRVLVLGDMLELGSVSADEHRRIGELAVKLPFDALFTYGESSALACRAAGPKCRGHFSSHAHLLEALKAFLAAHDVLLLKGSRGMRLERIAEGLRDMSFS
ncbi:MAG: UDP-N-acetylmuramoyl-tripeptide--D-alanyl-D-alanine ligase [Prosthecochloris sp.]|nr:UDP-N-acetylmuramoyl-tripeptide--D-alanyl-D-alanine ligase [Prosthecochloris sp.]